jgi:hypothetical protein
MNHLICYFDAVPIAENAEKEMVSLPNTNGAKGKFLCNGRLNSCGQIQGCSNKKGNRSVLKHINFGGGGG